MLKKLAYSLFFAHTLLLLNSCVSAPKGQPRNPSSYWHDRLEADGKAGAITIRLNKDGDLDGEVKGFLKAFRHADEKYIIVNCFTGDACRLFDKITKLANSEIEDDFRVRSCEDSGHKAHVNIESRKSAVQSFNDIVIPKCEKDDPYDFGI